MFQNKSPSRDRDGSIDTNEDEEGDSHLWLTTPLREPYRPPPPPAGLEEGSQTVFVPGTDEHQQITASDFPQTLADIEAAEQEQRRTAELEAGEFVLDTMVVRFRDEMAGLPRWSAEADERQRLLQRLLHDEQRRMLSESAAIAAGRGDIEAEEAETRQRMQLQQRLEQAGVRIAVGVVTDPMMPPDVTELAMQTDDVVIKELDESEDDDVDDGAERTTQRDHFPNISLVARVAEQQRREEERRRRREMTAQQADEERERRQQQSSSSPLSPSRAPAAPPQSRLRLLHQLGTEHVEKQAADEEDFFRKTQDNHVLDNAMRHVVQQCEHELEHLRSQVATSRYAAMSATKLRGDIRTRDRRIRELEMMVAAAESERQRAEHDTASAEVFAARQRAAAEDARDRMHEALAAAEADAAVGAILAAADAVIEERVELERKLQREREEREAAERARQEEEDAALAAEREAERRAEEERNIAADTEQNKGCTAHRAMLSPTPTHKEETRHVSPTPRRPSPPYFLNEDEDGNVDGDKMFATPIKEENADDDHRTASARTRAVIMSPAPPLQSPKFETSSRSSADGGGVGGFASPTPRATAAAAPQEDALSARLEQLNDAVARVEERLLVLSTPRTQQRQRLPAPSVPAVIMSPSGPGSIAPTVTAATPKSEMMFEAVDKKNDSASDSAATPTQRPPSSPASVHHHHHSPSPSPAPSSPVASPMDFMPLPTSVAAAAAAAPPTPLSPLSDIMTPVLDETQRQQQEGDEEQEHQHPQQHNQPTLPEWLAGVVAMDQERDRGDLEAEERREFVRLRREHQFAEVDSQVNRALMSVQRQHGIGAAALAAGTPLSARSQHDEHHQQPEQPVVEREHVVTTPRPRGASFSAGDAYTPSASRAGSSGMFYSQHQPHQRQPASTPTAAVTPAERAANVSLFGPSWSPAPFSFQRTASAPSPPDNLGVRHVDPPTSSFASHPQYQQPRRASSSQAAGRGGGNSAARTLINNLRGSGGLGSAGGLSPLPFLSLAAAAAGAAPGSFSPAPAAADNNGPIFACATGRCGFCSRCMFGNSSPGGAAAAAASLHHYRPAAAAGGGPSSSPSPPPPPTMSSAAGSYFQTSAARARHNKAKELLDQSLQ